MGDALGSVGRRSALGLIGAASSGVCNLAIVIIANRALDLRGAGYFFVGVSLFTLLQGILSFGCDTGLQFWLPAADSASRRSLVRLATTVTALAGLLAAVVLVLFGESIGVAFGDTRQSGRGSSVLIVVASTIVFGPLGEAVFGALRGLDAVRISVVLERLVRPVLQVVLMLVTVTVHRTPTMMMAAWAVPVALTTVLGLVAFVRAVKGPAPATPVTNGQFVAYTWPRSIARGAQALIQRLDVLILAGLAGLETAGVYATASRCMVAGVTVGTAVQQTIQPTLRKAVVERRLGDVKALYATSTTWLVLVTWPFYLTGAVFAPAVMRLFGAGYGRGATALSILCVTMLVATACGMVDVVLLMLGRSWLSTVDTLAALVLNIVLNVILDPHFGPTGAAIAWSVAILTTNLVPLRQIGAHGLHPWGASLRTAITTSVLVVGLPLLVLRFMLGSGWMVALGGTAAALAAFACAALVQRDELLLDRLAGGFRRRPQRPVTLSVSTQVGTK